MTSLLVTITWGFLGQRYDSEFHEGSLFLQNTCVIRQGPRSKFSTGGGGGAKEECVKENLGGGGRGEHACGFLFNFSKVTENANNDKTIDFFPHLQ